MLQPKEFYENYGVHYSRHFWMLVWWVPFWPFPWISIIYQSLVSSTEFGYGWQVLNLNFRLFAKTKGNHHFLHQQKHPWGFNLLKRDPFNNLNPKQKTYKNNTSQPSIPKPTNVIQNRQNPQSDPWIFMGNFTGIRPNKNPPKNPPKKVRPAISQGGRHGWHWRRGGCPANILQFP